MKRLSRNPIVALIDMLPMRAATFAVLCVFGMEPVLLEAQQIAVSPTATSSKPIVGVTASGMPIVQIATPNQAGVSNNTYSQFNVGTPGLILNNSGGNVLTQQAGYVTGNPNLASGSARVILNQVVGGSTSQLLGYTEVAGPAADVIIANPAGIYCNGCGFINTNRGVLTTGTAVFGGSGSLDAFHVTGGQIQIGGSGLNSSTVDEVDLIARSVVINGQVWAGNAINVVAGANDVQYGGLSATALTPDANRPAVAIDVAQLGGMYAGKITLVGTETGVGVNSAGTLAAQAGDVSVSSQGQVTLSGTTSASGNVSINAVSGIDNAGSIYASQNASLVSQGAVSNSGTLAALGNTTVTAASVNSTGALGAGIDTSGNVTGAGNLSLSATGQVTTTGQNLAGGNVAVSGSGLDMTGSRTLASGNASLTATDGDVTQTGATLVANGAFNVSATGAFVNDQGQVSASLLGISAGNLSNRGGTLVQTGAGTTTLSMTGVLDNTSGTIDAGGAMSVTAGNVQNASGRIVSRSAAGFTLLASGQIANAAGTTAQGATGGVIGGNGDANIEAASLTNSGTLTAAQTLGIAVTGALDNSGGTLTADDLTASAASLKNAGGTISANSVAATAQQFDNTSGQIVANQLGLNATELTNEHGVLTQLGTGAMGLNVSGTLDNSNSGLIQTNSTDLTIDPASLNNNGGAIVHAGTGTLTVDPGQGSGVLTNVGGQIATNGKAVVVASSLDNTAGTIAAQSDLSVTTQGALNDTNGKLAAGSDITLSSGGVLTNASGQIGAGQQGGASALTASAASINNTGGAISNAGSGTATLDGGSQIANAGGQITGNGAVTLDASSISNTQGAQISGTSIEASASNIDNSSGRIGNVGTSVGDVTMTASTLTNTGGQIGASRNLVVTASTLAGGGSYSAVNDLNLNLQGDFTTASNYSLSAGHDLTFTLPGTFDNGGFLMAVGNLGIDAASIDNSGTLAAGGLLSTQSATLVNTGTIVGGSVTLTAAQSIQNLGTSALIGATDSAGTLALLAPDIENRDDTTPTDTQATTAIYGLGSVVLAGGKDANGNYVNAGLVLNQSALIQSGGDMQIAANQVTNTRRAMSTSGFTSSVDPNLLASLGISLSGQTGQVGVQDPDSIGGVYTDPPHGGQWNSTYEFTTYTGVAVANTVTSTSPQAQIISGGNLNAGSVGTFQNYWSAVAATGNIATPATLDQDSWQGQTAPEVQVTYSGEYHYNNYDNSEHDWQLPFGDAPFVGSGPGGYSQAAPADIRTYALPAYESTFTAGGTISGSGVTINNTAGNAGVAPLGLLPGQSISGNGHATAAVQGGQVSGGGIANGDNPIIAKSVALNVLDNITIPQGGLFSVDKAPNAPYLVQTNSAFTSQQQFLSSDYYFEQMGLNPSQIQMRLGDGFYEQQLVQSQILSLTGQSVLTNYASTQDEYEALMTSGAQLATSLDLAPGTALTPQQVSQLTSNVVIMETEVVDGQSVLVPVVYLAQASQDDMGSGPVIAATNIDLQNAQSVTNSGTIAASNNLTLAAQTIDSTDGTLKSGNQMSLVSVGNVNLTSATVNAGNLALQAGGNLILDTAANTLDQVSASGATRSTTTLGPAASINVTGNAAIVTGGNLEQDAGSLNVGGALGMSIGGDWTLGAQQTGETKVVARANGISDTSLVSDTGSTVNVGGVSSIMVGGDLTATGANINLGGGGTVEAAGNVTLQAATATSTVDSNSSGSDHHGSYSETLHTSDDVVTGTAITSGDSLAIVSGGNLNITGSSVSLDKGDALLMAAGSVNVSATTETHVSDTAQNSSHSGVASHTSSVDQVDQSVTYADGSSISADGVAIVSGKDINVIGSSVVGTNSVALAAQGNVNILAATDTYQDSEYHDVKHSGLSGSGGIGFSVGSSEQKDQYDTNTVTQSQSRSTVGSVAGNVSISAGSDVHIGGSDIVAGQAANDTTGATGNIGIQAQNITIDPSQDTAQAQDQQSSRSSGLTVGVTGTPLDTARNLQAAGSSGNAYQRTTGVANEVTASTLDTPSVSVSYGSSKSSSTSDISSLSNSGSTIRGAGNVTLVATGGALKDANGNPLDGNITVTGSTITAGAAATFAANHDVTFQASTDQLQQSSQSSSSSTGISLAAPSLGDVSRWVQGGPNSGGVSASPYNASNSSANGNSASTQQTASVVTGNSVVVTSQTGDINVIGSGISGTQAVSLIAAQGAINVLAGTEANTNDQESSSHQIGDLGSNGTGTGFSVGVASSQSVQDAAAQTQSTIRSQIVSGNGDVTLDANKDVTVQGSDLAAAKDLTLIGQNLNLDPGTDATQNSASQSSSQFGVTLALGGVAGNAVATVNQAMTTQSEDANNPRLAALDKAEAGLAAYGAVQAATSGTTSPALIKVTVSIGGGTSHSESQSNATATDGSTLTAGGAATLIATGSGAKDANGDATDGDINSVGTQITAQSVTLDAARDINLTSARDTTQNTNSNSSSSASIGVGASLGGTQNGFTIDLAASGAKGNTNGNSVTNENTQITAANTVSITSGRDTNLVGASVSGDTVDADVGRNLTITSPQDRNTYNSQQSSAGFQASICVPPICYGQTVSGSASASDQSIKDNFQSVNQQSGIFAGDGGFDVTVGNHTQLNGGVVASTATPDNNTLSTQTFGYTNLQNIAQSSGSTIGFSASGGAGQSTPGGMSFTPPVQTGSSIPGAQNSQGQGPLGFGVAGTSNSASGTTYAAVSPGTIIVRGDAGTGQDSTAGLSRDTATANGAVQNTFNAQTVANDMAIQQVAGQVGMQVVGDVATSLENKANAKVAQDQQALADAQASGDPASIAQATANLGSDQQQAALWGNDGAARIASHAAVAALGAALGGGSVAGAVGGTVAGDVAGNAVGGATGSTLLGNIAAGAAGAVAGGALGGSAGALSGANGALSADLFNRQLHPEERTLIANAANEIAASQTQNPADQAQIVAYWTSLLTLVANADVDAEGQQQLDQTVSQMQAAAQASGNYQNLQSFEQSLAAAQQIVQDMSGQTVINEGGSVVADDGVLKTFQATGSQKNDSSLFGTPGGTEIGLAIGETPASVGIGSQYYVDPNGLTNQQVTAFVNGLVQQMATPNGAVTPDYTIESLLFGNVTGKIAAGMLEVTLGSGANVAAGRGLAALEDATPVTPTGSGFVNATKVCESGCVLSTSTPQQQSLVRTIISDGDPTGQLTENLIDAIGQSDGYTSLAGGKYGSNNGFDHVFEDSSGNVTLIVDSKQITGGTFTLSPNAAGGNMQLSDDWIDTVLSKLDPTSPAYKAVSDARFNGTLTTAVAGVDKATGQVIAVPVKVSNR